MTTPRLITLLAIAASLAGCCGTADYTAFIEHQPRSILVLPPINETASLEASTATLATISRPLAEHGYYVFPVAVVDRMMKANGLPMPGDMHAAPLDRLRDVFGADAVMYVTVTAWDTNYLVLATANTVVIKYELVDLATGERLWHNSAEAKFVTMGLTPVDMLVAAAVHAATSAASEIERGLAPAAHERAFNAKDSNCKSARLLKGPRHPDYKTDRQRAERSQPKAPAPDPQRRDG